MTPTACADNQTPTSIVRKVQIMIKIGTLLAVVGATLLAMVLASSVSADALIDIKPGSDLNSINTNSNGLIPVAILTTDDFDATTVDPDSVEFGPAGASRAHRSAHVEDVDDDGDLDLVFHFRTQDTGIASGDVEACLAFETFDGTPFVVCDSVRTVPTT